MTGGASQAMLGAELATAVGIAILAFGVRVVVHSGRSPGGVDTWYYLAYANAFRRRPSIRVLLPQYLLQEPRQSYPPLFPTLLALIPREWLDRWYWAVAPAIDCFHLLVLYVVALRLTHSVVVAAMAAATYAFTPQLISESRSLTSRPFGMLLHTSAVLVLLKYTLTDSHWAWLLASTLAATLLFLSSAAMSAAFVFVCGVFSVGLADMRYVAVPLIGVALATVVTAGHMLLVIRNYLHALRYWYRNHSLFGRHPVRDSPHLGGPPSAERGATLPGFLGQTVTQQLLRLIGENPFLLALPFTPTLPVPWGQRIQLWAIALAGLSVIATILPPLRAFGPGRAYVKAAIFPTAYTLAAGVGSGAGFARPLGLITLVCLLASVAAIVFFVVRVRTRSTEHTASVPDGLRDAVTYLGGLEPGSVFVLPYMYADYTAYFSRKPVAWGGHCGAHDRFEWITPVIRRPLSEMFAELGIRYLLIDERYVSVSDLQLTPPPRLLLNRDGFQVHECDVGAESLEARTSLPAAAV